MKAWLFSRRVRWILILASFILAFVLFYRFAYVTPILTYHHINTVHLDALNTVSPDAFAYQMQLLKRWGVRVISFEEYVSAREHGKNIFGAVVIHFDDGYRDNYDYAFPVLKKYNFPAAIFVVSDKVDTGDYYITWSQAKEMARQGITIGSHTRRHAYLPALSENEARDEVEGSKRIIEEQMGKPVDFFVYPVGGYSDMIKGLVKQAGYRAAGTTNRGRSRLNKDLWELNRIRVKESDKDFYLWCKISGFYNLFRRSKYSEEYRKGVL